MTVREILAEAGVVSASSDNVYERPVRGLAYDSRKVDEGFLFFAFAGHRDDGRRFASDAVGRGAVAVVYEQLPQPAPEHPFVVVSHGRHALAAAARRFFQHPDDFIRVIGFTGTNGKSTGTMLTDGILRHAGKTTSLINTIGYHQCGVPMKAVNTTPESLDIYRIAAATRDCGGEFLTMEISSHGLDLGRVEYLHVAAAVFTNLTRDHLDFHGDMERYFSAKARLFGEEFHPDTAILNLDDPWTARIPIGRSTAKLTYGLAENADLRAVNINSSFQGLHFEIAGKTSISSKLVGEINVYNILAAAGACYSVGLSWEQIAAGVQSFAGVPGRFEQVEAGQPFLVVVDYAHTDAAIENVTAVARQLLSGRGRIITLFGCGGDRDRTKRPLMAEAAGRGSDFVILTSDNPRSEDPLAIINDAMVGAQRQDTPLAVEPDREKAIFVAISEARAGDIVIIAGKGHEDYQILRDRTIAFSDREVALRALAARGFTEPKP